MQKVAYRVFMDYEKEEAWLNEMAAKGFALTDFFFCRYKFSDCEPGEYIYRIELLDNLPSHMESRAYIDFMAENGVEHVASWFRWVYFRRKAGDGQFDIYSDIGSRIKHYQGILALWLPILIMDAIIGVMNLVQGIGRLAEGGREDASFSVIIGSVLIALAAAIFYHWVAMRIKINRLKKAKQLLE